MVGGGSNGENVNEQERQNDSAELIATHRVLKWLARFGDFFPATARRGWLAHIGHAVHTTISRWALAAVLWR